MTRLQPQRTAPLLAMLLASLSAWSTRTDGQSRPPSVGTASTGVLGPAVPAPAPIGGLPTRPLTPSASPPRTDRYRRVGTVLLSVPDAPRPLGAVVLSAPDNGVAYGGGSRDAWTPTSERPRWIRDTAEAPVQAWRDLIVTDVVCNLGGACLERRQRIRARWIAGCACYAFADAWNRIWRVE